MDVVATISQVESRYWPDWRPKRSMLDTALWPNLKVISRTHSSEINHCPRSVRSQFSGKSQIWFPPTGIKTSDLRSSNTEPIYSPLKLYLLQRPSAPFGVKTLRGRSQGSITTKRCSPLSALSATDWSDVYELYVEIQLNSIKYLHESCSPSVDDWSGRISEYLHKRWGSSADNWTGTNALYLKIELKWK